MHLQSLASSLFIRKASILVWKIVVVWCRGVGGSWSLRERVSVLRSALGIIGCPIVGDRVSGSVRYGSALRVPGRSDWERPSAVGRAGPARPRPQRHDASRHL